MPSGRTGSESSGSAVRPSALVTPEVTSWRAPPVVRYSSTPSPAAGAPRYKSKMGVEIRATLSPQGKAQAAIRRPGFGIHAERVAGFGYGIPGSILAFQIPLRDLGYPAQHIAANLIDDLLDASGFKPVEDFLHHAPRLRRNRALGVPGAGFGVRPVQAQPHV